MFDCMRCDAVDNCTQMLQAVVIKDKLRLLRLESSTFKGAIDVKCDDFDPIRTIEDLELEFNSLLRESRCRFISDVKLNTINARLGLIRHKIATKIINNKGDNKNEK